MGLMPHRRGAGRIARVLEGARRLAVVLDDEREEEEREGAEKEAAAKDA